MYNIFFQGEKKTFPGASPPCASPSYGLDWMFGHVRVHEAQDR